MTPVQHQGDIPLAGGSEGSLVLRIVAGDGLMRVFLGAHIPIAFHVEMAHGKLLKSVRNRKSQADPRGVRQMRYSSRSQ